MAKHNGLRTWIEIDRNAIKKNFKALRRCISKNTRFMAVVKSNAYGHDMVPFAKEIVHLGADWLGVDSIEEALTLRGANIQTPILVLGYTLPTHFKTAAERDISVTISNVEFLAALREAHVKKPLHIHIKVDTGLNRQGFQEADIQQVLRFLARVNRKKINIVFGGLYSHFAAAGRSDTGRYTRRQISSFEKWCATMLDAGFDPLCHIGATSAIMMYPRSHFDMVRAGIGLYGLWPSITIQKELHTKMNLHPALTWKARIGDVKDIPAGSCIGYDCLETTSRNSTIAVVPVGYWHGLSRKLSGGGYVLVRGRCAKILGAISMGMLTIDVTDIHGVKTGDEVVLLGKQGRDHILTEDISEQAGISNYEIITRINQSIPRFYQ